MPCSLIHSFIHSSIQPLNPECLSVSGTVPGAGDTGVMSEAPQHWEGFGALCKADARPGDLSPTQACSSSEPASAPPPASYPGPRRLCLSSQAMTSVMSHRRPWPACNTGGFGLRLSGSILPLLQHDSGGDRIWNVVRLSIFTQLFCSLKPQAL